MHSKCSISSQRLYEKTIVVVLREGLTRSEEISRKKQRRYRGQEKNGTGGKTLKSSNIVSLIYFKYGRRMGRTYRGQL